ncbi:MAG TPA: molybdopterin-binding protein [Egibacteraceae bacterium]|nr:molybdopterin-binding protein [Egibacteraceae bacterium]
MTRRLRASILVIGDEILGGFVTDTNSGWVARRLQVLGVPLDRIVTVPDDASAIHEALHTELARSRPRLVLTSGGIGSTPDDVTLEAVAASLGLGLHIHPDIDAQITAAVQRTVAAGITVSPGHARSMRKMARVPEGSSLLRHPEDETTALAPGVAVDVDGGSGSPQGATVIVLPGIPSELRRIVSDFIEPTFLAGRGEPEHVAECTHGYPESTLNPILDRLAVEFPDVHVGSYPGRECVVRLKGAKERVEAAESLVTAYLERLGADPASARLRSIWQSRWRE